MAQKKKTGTQKKASRRKTASKRKPKQPRAPRTTEPRDPRLPAVGKTIKRTFKGKDYELRVTKDGFQLGDVAFRSLTAAAKAVTKYAAVSGPRFWLGADEKGGSK